MAANTRANSVTTEIKRDIPERGSPERDFLLTRILTDTGFYARYVLGMDTDRDENGNALNPEDIGKGGIRDYGPHQEVVEFFDDDSIAAGIVMAPRASYKSSIARALIQRKIIAHPNISILLAMHDYDLAVERCRAIRDDLLENPILAELFPHMKGTPWRNHKFVTGLRTDRTGDSPTLYVCSPKKTVTSTRPHFILLDDIVTEEDLSDIALAAGRRLIEKCLALEARGCRLLDVGTPYHYGDAHHMCLESPGWKKLVHLDVGFDVVVREDRTVGLEGKARWPHLTKSFLASKLGRGMTFATFMSQYKLQVVSGTHQPFHREHFQPVAWKDNMRELTGYLLCDAAQGSPEGEKSTAKQCLNCLMYIGIDDRNHVTLLDLELGKWPMLEFCDRYIAMRDRWSSKVTHRVEIWEQVVGSTPYAEFISLKMQARGDRPQIVWQKRHQGVKNKKARISGTQVRFQAREVHICSTVPRTYVDEGEKKMLWHPEGHTDSISGSKMPGGTLVDQFIRFPYVGDEFMDCSDTFSLVDAMDKETGQTVCFHVKPSRQIISEERRRKPIERREPRGAADRFFGRQRKSRR